MGAQAQPIIPNWQADLALPSGTVPGRLFEVDNYLVFYDQDRPESSFSVTRQDVLTVADSTGGLTVDTKMPLPFRGGSQTHLTFQLRDSRARTSIMNWSKRGIEAIVPTPSPATNSTSSNVGAAAAPESAARVSFEVKHNHRIGSCSGRLVIEEDRLVFESISEINDSRRWALRDIKELKRKSPYAMEVVPFTGNTYAFQLIGEGMDSDVFTQLVKRVTNARIN